MTSPTRSWWLRPPALLTVVFLLVVAGVVAVQSGVFTRAPHDPAGSGATAGPPLAAQFDRDPLRHPCAPGTPRTGVTVVASTEKSDLIKRMADFYDTRVADGCAAVSVEGIQSGKVATQLRDSGRAGTGPTPADVWIPAASLWVGVAKGPVPGSNAASRALGVPDFGYSVASTPLVFAVPRAAATSIGWPSTERAWTDLPATLGKTNPLVSTPGLFALLSTLRATPGLPPGLDLAKVSDPRAAAFARSVEARVVHYGDSEQDFLSNLAAAPPGDPSYAGAVPVEEKAVWDYNHDNPQALVELQSPAPRPENEQLAAITPSGGTFYSDSPFLVLHEQKRAAADDFRKWLLEPDQQQYLQRYGFRNARGEPGGQLGPASGLSGTNPTPLPLPDAATVNAARDSWSGWRKPANVLLVVDGSGSMNDPIPEGSSGPPRLDAVRAAAERALDSRVGLGSADQLAMWTFSSAPDAVQAPYRQVVPAGPSPPAVLAQGEPVGAAVPAVKGVLATLVPGGDTALYRTTRDAVAAMRAPGVYRSDRINAVVLLTDGAESVETLGSADRSVEAQAVARTLQAVTPTPDRPVRVFYIAYSPGATPAKETLSQIAQRSGGAVYDATDATKIDEVFTDVVSNF